jgi:hypothetical protein
VGFSYFAIIGAMEIQTHTIRFKRAFRIAFATILVTTLLLKPQSASACSCYGTVYYASQMMKKNDAVFVGYVEREFSMSRVPGVRNALDTLLYRSLHFPKVSL